MAMIGKVRRMKLRDKLSNSTIAKLTGLSRNTVKMARRWGNRILRTWRLKRRRRLTGPFVSST